MKSALIFKVSIGATALFFLLLTGQSVYAADLKSGSFHPFTRNSFIAGVSAGVGFGASILGSQERHDLALAYGHIGRIMTGTLAESSSYAGNLALFGEVFGGVQYDPEDAYLAGLTFGPRYYFKGLERLKPFVDAGAGVSITDIGEPDLSTTFQFNLSLSAGIFYFLRDDFAVSFQMRGIHLSNAYIEEPNNGVNTLLFLIGLNWVYTD